MKWFTRDEKPRHVLSAQQFDRDDLEKLFIDVKYIDDLVREAKQGDLPARRQWHELKEDFSNYMLYSLFYEPSTRTRLSFGTAARSLGMQVIETENAREFSSGAKGESLEDTVQNVMGFHPYPILAMRYDEPGGAIAAAEVSGTMPVINAGDAHGEHPTQALLDLYTIKTEVGRIDGLTILIGGDLRNGRTVHSLVMLASIYRDVHFILVSPPELKLPEKYLKAVLDNDCTYEEHYDFLDLLPQAEVVYWTRVQKERLPGNIDVGLSREYRRKYRLTNPMVNTMPEFGIVMHPLPRDASDPELCEIAIEVDQNPRAKYFQQAWNGVPVRMAILTAIIEQQEHCWH